MQTFNDYLTEQADLFIKKAENLSKRSKRQYIYNVAVLTIYGFQVTIPVVLGIWVGSYLDQHLMLSHISWTLNFILIGFVVGFYNANRWFYHSMGLKKRKKGGKK